MNLKVFPFTVTNGILNCLFLGLEFARLRAIQASTYNSSPYHKKTGYDYPL